MADDQDGAVLLFFVVCPVGRCEQVDDAVAGAEAQIGFERQTERLGSLLAAPGGAGDDVQVLRGV